MGNYIADWLLTGALNNTSQEATDFQKAMRDNPAQAELLQAVRDTFQEMSEMTPTQQIAGTIVSETGRKPFSKCLSEKVTKVV